MPSSSHTLLLSVTVSFEYPDLVPSSNVQMYAPGAGGATYSDTAISTSPVVVPNTLVASTVNV